MSEDKYLKKTDCPLPPPSNFPGSFHKDNKSGTLLSREEWKKNEFRKWVIEMQKNVKYEQTPFGYRAACAKSWMSKTFAKSKSQLPIVYIKDLLMEIEIELAGDTNTGDNADGSTSRGKEDEVTERIDVDNFGLEEAMDVDYSEINDSPDLFADSDNEEERPTKKKSMRLEREEKQEETILGFMKRSDLDLIENEALLPDCVRRSERYQTRKKVYIKNFIDSKFDQELTSSQDILEQLTQLPKYIREDELLQQRLCHLTKQEKSAKRCLKNLIETLQELRKDSSVNAFEQRVAIVASVIDHRFGCPDLGETYNVMKAAKNLKENFLTGKVSNLKGPGRKKPERYPQEVFDIAHDSWIKRSTKPDPAKHARPKTALKDGKETVPTIWQVVTDDEAYAQFKENDCEPVRNVMERYCDQTREKYRNKKDSDSKRKTMAILERRQNAFPGKTWFLARKPPQTKFMDDFSTALCKECNEALLNYETIRRYCRKFCKCKTSSCPNWVCECDEDDSDNCECEEVCRCEDCESCQVRTLS